MPDLPSCNQMIQEWVNQYKQDETISSAQKAAIAAMDSLLQSWGDLDPSQLKDRQAEVNRMITILQAFQGRLYITDALINGVSDDKQ